MEKNTESAVQTLEQGNQGWVYYRELDPIPDNLLGLNVCTLDFKVKPRFTIGELPEDRAFHELVRNPKLIKDDFIIHSEDIIDFLSLLEEATGGEGTFRHLTVMASTIRNYKWNLKFLNLYLSPLNNGFIVCDRFSRAIRYKDIIPNIVYADLYWGNSKNTNDERGILTGDIGVIRQP